MSYFFRVNRSVFFKNSAKNYGGAIEVAYTRVTEFQNCRFLNNTVGRPNGGAAVRLVVDEWLVSGVVVGSLVVECIGSTAVLEPTLSLPSAYLEPAFSLP